MVARRNYEALQHNEEISRPMPKIQRTQNDRIADITKELDEGLSVTDFLTRASYCFEPAVVKNYISNY